MDKARVCILDYGSGNVGSVANLFELIGADVRVSNSVGAIRDATHLVLPGVGACGASMKKITERIPLEQVEHEVFSAGKPFLEICVGMQVLAERGLEFGEHQGLGWVPGMVSELSADGLPLPHVGWNDVRRERESPLLTGFDLAQDFYFVHSYAFRATAPEHVVATTEYGERFAAVIRRVNGYGVQFHPEKRQDGRVRSSGGGGLVARFARLVDRGWGLGQGQRVERAELVRTGPQ